MRVSLALSVPGHWVCNLHSVIPSVLHHLAAFYGDEYRGIKGDNAYGNDVTQNLWMSSTSLWWGAVSSITKKMGFCCTHDMQNEEGKYSMT